MGHDLEHNLPVELIPHGNTNRGKLWMHNGYSYIKNKEANGTVYLVCRMQKCCKVVARLNNKKKVFYVSGPHKCHD